MDNLHWHLSVLSKAIHYKNLSGAAVHVGLSQPQLSRIISRLEGDLGVVLLDRAARRKSGWTPVAFKIAETYSRSSRKLTQALQQVKSDGQLTQITIGSLEGLAPLATAFARQLLDLPKTQLVELNVFDLSELEERFEREELDLIFTAREPGMHKYRYSRILGYQSVERTTAVERTMGRADNTLKVYSQFEYAQHLHSRRSPMREARGNTSKVLLSNSLSLRRQWIDEFGGTGFVPGEVRRKRLNDADVTIYLIASDLLSPTLWEKIEKFRL
jgi:DNA-binding transcriptional LysR family regulator